MSTTSDDRPATEAVTTGGRRQWARGYVVAAVVAMAGLVLLGYRVGLQSPWSAHDPALMNGTVERVRADEAWGIFTSDHGLRVDFRLDEVVWRTEQTTGSDSVPPCLRRLDASVEAEVGVIEVNRPFGSGSYWKVLSLTCPPGG